MRLHIQRNLKEGKELLSRRSEHTFRLRFKQTIEFKWSREEFETFTASTVNRALDCLREQLRKMTNDGIKPKQVLLIGGSSSMPVIKRRIEDELGIKPILWEHSQTAVALGAAHAADSDKGSRAQKYSKEFISAPSNSSSQSIEIGDKPGGAVTLTADQITAVGALISGSVTFSDGQVAKWYLDQMGRLGLSGAPQRYQAPKGDIPQFQQQLDLLMTHAGF